MKKRKGLLFLLTLVSCFMLASCGKNGKTPYIGENGNWWIGEEDTGVPAKGDKGDKGDSGQDGSSTTILSINKTGSIGNVDIYTILFSDNKTTTFTVTNGKDGDNGNDGKDLTIKKVEKTGTSGLIDTYTITFSNDSTTSFTITNGRDGEIVTIADIQKTQTVDLVDTYTVTYTDGNSFSFTVTNGKDGKDGQPGLTPYIGENGNWWIGEEDTGVPVSLSYDERELTPESTGFVYTHMTVNGKSGLVLTSVEDSAKTLWQNMYNNGEEVNIIIPNYVASTPVIGIADEAFDGTFITSISLSKNTVYLGEESLNSTKLTSVDFNNCKIEEIPEGCFADCSELKRVDLPSTVKKLGVEAFEHCPLEYIDISNVTWFGNESLYNYRAKYLLLKEDVEYVGRNVFENCYFVYLEHEEKPTSWADNIGATFMREITDDVYPTNVRENDEFVYAIIDNKVTLYQYLGSEKKYTVPATLEGLPINALGVGFNTYCFNEDDYGSMSESEIICEIMKNNDGYIDEIIVKNNVKKVEKGALLNGNMLIYIGKNVREIYIDENNDLAIGGFYDMGLAGLVIIEDKDETNIRYNDSLISYDDLLAEEDWYEFRIKANIDYDDIYFDENYGVYYAKESLASYKAISTKLYYESNITILDSINQNPVKTIDRYAILLDKAGKITIGSNVTRIRKNGIYVADGSTLLYIPNSVEIINSQGIYLDNETGTTIYVQTSDKPEDWDTNWNVRNVNVVYSTSKSDFDNIIYDGVFKGVLKSDGTVEITEYTKNISSGSKIRIPRKIDGKNVTSIKQGLIKITSNIQNITIYIPSTITSIEGRAFEFYVSTNTTSYYPNIRLEAENVPSGYATDWYYNTYTSNQQRINIYTNETLDY